MNKLDDFPLNVRKQFERQLAIIHKVQSMHNNIIQNSEHKSLLWIQG